MPTSEEFFIALPGIKARGEWGRLAHEFDLIDPTSGVLQGLLAIPDVNIATTTLSNDLRKALALSVGALLTSLDTIREEADGTFKATGKLSSIHPGFLQDTAFLRDKVKASPAQIPPLTSDELFEIANKLCGNEYEVPPPVTMLSSILAREPPAVLPVTQTFLCIQLGLPPDEIIDTMMGPKQMKDLLVGNLVPGQGGLFEPIIHLTHASDTLLPDAEYLHIVTTHRAHFGSPQITSSTNPVIKSQCQSLRRALLIGDYFGGNLVYIP